MTSPHAILHSVADNTATTITDMEAIRKLFKDTETKEEKERTKRMSEQIRNSFKSK